MYTRLISRAVSEKLFAEDFCSIEKDNKTGFRSLD